MVITDPDLWDNWECRAKDKRSNHLKVVLKVILKVILKVVQPCLTIGNPCGE
jgi:hypothetical protein